MAFEEGVDQLPCQACGAMHNARWSRMPVRERSTVTCLACGGIVYQGNSVRDYFDVRRTDQP